MSNDHASGSAPEPVPDLAEQAFEVRDTLRVQSEPVPRELRVELLEDKKGTEIPPSMFVDGADPPATFIGIHDRDKVARLRNALKRLEHDARKSQPHSEPPPRSAGNDSPDPPVTDEL